MARWRILCGVVLLGLLAGCSPKPAAQTFVGTDITGAALGSGLQLTDHQGHARSLQDFRGKLVVLFFGYTHCPDVCPTTMDDLAKAMKLLGNQRRQVQVLFVTLDPERDTVPVLAQYVPAFDRDFLGLTGTQQQIEATAAQFKVYAQKQPVAGKSGYTIDHSAGCYVFDQQGRPRLYLHFGQQPRDIAHDLLQLLEK